MPTKPETTPIQRDTRTQTSRVLTILTSGFVLIIAVFLASTVSRLALADGEVAGLRMWSRFPAFSNIWTRAVSTVNKHTALESTQGIPDAHQSDRLKVGGESVTMTNRTPVYFVSHGGPGTMFDTAHPVFAELKAIGREITEKVKPSAIVVFSAHWQARRSNTIEVNVSEQEPLLYDFYGFPRHFYQAKLPNKGSPQLARRVISVLNENGIRTQQANRGLDHGVFVPFKVMFDPNENPFQVPVVQVSLFDDDTDAEAHIKLGRAVEKLRDENILIVASGMSVHNLRQPRFSGKPMPYAVSFDGALKDAAETKPGEHRDEVMIDLLERSDARQAHPTFEHLLPIHIAVGAAGEDQGKQLWTLPEGSMAWAQYRFGEVQAAA